MLNIIFNDNKFIRNTAYQKITPFIISGLNCNSDMHSEKSTKTFYENKLLYLKIRIKSIFNCVLYILYVSNIYNKFIYIYSYIYFFQKAIIQHLPHTTGYEESIKKFLSYCRTIKIFLLSNQSPWPSLYVTSQTCSLVLERLRLLLERIVGFLWYNFFAKLTSFLTLFFLLSFFSTMPNITYFTIFL